MTDQKKDESIIELTEVIEEVPNSAAGEWMETTPPPSPKKEIAEPPRGPLSGGTPDPKGLSSPGGRQRDCATWRLRPETAGGHWRAAPALESPD